MINQLTNELLLSIGQICDQGCTALFSKQKMQIFKNKELLFTADRDWTDGLWKLNLKTLQAHYIVKQDKSKTELAQYLHACAFSPVISTFEECIKTGNFLIWPGIDILNVKKLLGTTNATIKGHLDQERKNLQSTKPNITKSDTTF